MFWEKTYLIFYIYWGELKGFKNLKQLNSFFFVNPVPYFFKKSLNFQRTLNQKSQTFI